MTVPHTIPGLCRFQADLCRKLGSSLYDHLLNRCAEDYEQGGPVRELLEPHKDDPRGSVVALRLMGAVHRLVLEGRAPRLAQFYPSSGGTVRLEGGDVWETFSATLREQMPALRQLICQPVQTNEVGRCGALLGGFLLVAHRTGLPLRLLEIGSSAGLNLRWDHFRYTWKGGAWGDPASPVVLQDVFASEAVPPVGAVKVVERRGCDPSPIDATSTAGRLTLQSFIWPEQLERRALLQAALEVARTVPCVVDCARAAGWLRARLEEPAPGKATVVFHSIVWQYLSHEERDRVAETITAAGSRATAEAPVAWLRMEPGRDSAEIRLEIFPGFAEQLIATAGYHSAPATWLAPPS
ncbi:MAG TPA: DUF2332 domain-containing protein [Candidatus Angelobacter sp.]|nr:DUF2332 domain-containing protein [Candidatus Angelobacter sp.]